MSQKHTALFKTALKAMRVTGTDKLVSPFTAGAGVVFMGHHVAPDTNQDFEPNRTLRISPEFLETVICEVRSRGFDIISLDAVPERLDAARRTGGRAQPFACFTFDDGYRDNREYALPVFEKYNAPLAIYVPTDYADGQGDLWWLRLERAIATAAFVRISMDGAYRRFETETPEQKQIAYHQIYWWLRTLPENRARAVAYELAQSAGVHADQLCSDLVMNWDELRDLADHPLVTIGAHTNSHRALAKLDAKEAKAEMASSIARIEDELATPCHHFSYPYGSHDAAAEREFEIAKDLGLVTAVTTRKGVLHSDMAGSLTALPRLSLNGDFQDVTYVRTLLSGAPFALFNAVNRLTGKMRQA
ncbi:MAG: polysaccharide deacetylase family protein [Pseudomonadota bacterium]